MNYLLIFAKTQVANSVWVLTFGKCASEVQDATNVLEETAPVLENEVTQIGDDVVQTVQGVTDKARSVDQFLSDAQRFIGDRYERISSGVYRSMERLRQVRFTDRDLLPTHGTIGPHGHFELLNELGEVIKNIHIPLIGR